MDDLLQKLGIDYGPFDSKFARAVFERASEAAARASREAVPVDHLGLSSATVEQVASNRRILGADGKVEHVRCAATSDPAVRAFPEGVIDPQLRMVSFWQGETPVVALTYYATHPQSYYRTGKANPDFPGMARNAQQEKSGVSLIHFNGAGGNVTAGKYNDGAHENRQLLADRLADAMSRAWTATKRVPMAAEQVKWKSVPVRLPAATHLDETQLAALIANEQAPVERRFIAANQLVWLRRCLSGDSIDLSCLSLGNARVLHMPGELFVEYQLEASRLASDQFVAMAAYGDYATAYIGTAVAYNQGGYETGPDVSFVSPEVEAVLLKGIAELLDVNPNKLRPLR